MAKSRPDRAGSEPLVALQTYGPAVPKISDAALIEQLTTERDRYAAMLLSAEQELARTLAKTLVEQELVERAEAQRDELEPFRDAYLVLVNSRSWRMVKPLRVAGGIVRSTGLVRIARLARALSRGRAEA